MTNDNNQSENCDLELQDKSSDSLPIEQDEYSFGWNNYSETTNGRFAMIGILAILLIELFSKESFLSWCGLFN